MKIVSVSGGFDPIHSGHIEYIKSAKDYGEKLIVILNSDEWLKKKKGKFFLQFKERKNILENLKFVDEVIGFEDDEQGSCKNGLIKIQEKYPKDKIIFCNGGDRSKENIPEMSLQGIEFIFGVGGNNKINSSSDLLKNWKFTREERRWGSYFEIFQEKNLKLKELIINPFQGMSFQRHSHRNELWFVSEGSCLVKHSCSTEQDKKEYSLSKEDTFHVKKNEWHQIINPYKEVCKIIEIQYGEKVEETDVERLFYFNEEKIQK
tara:strand:+ start:6076 stop:6861 length:786 start_codon:yes stop_codon:yes gene_type:complete